MDTLRAIDALRHSGDVPTDVALVCADGVKVGAHALVCAAISPVLRAAFKPSCFKEGESRTVNLDYAMADMMEKMFSFACGCDEKEISGDDAMDLLPLADRLDFARLRSACESALEAILTSDNAADILACAEASGRPNLAMKARDVVESDGVPDVIRSLMDKKRKLVVSLNDVEGKVDALRKKQGALERDIKDAEDQIVFESNKAFREASAAASSTASAGQVAEGDVKEYPHAAGRKLIALPRLGTGLDALKRKRILDEKYGDGPLVFKCLSTALEAAGPGDVIQLPPGRHEPHYPYWVYGIKKSLQIVGIADGVTITNHNREETIFDIEGADVRIANAKIKGNIDFLVMVSKGGQLWLEDCKLDQCSSSPVEVRKNASAYI